MSLDFGGTLKSNIVLVTCFIYSTYLNSFGINAEACQYKLSDVTYAKMSHLRLAFLA